MSKKYFIYFTFIGALLILSIVPIINYTSDPSRIFHKDYKTQYKEFHPNKLFLKVAYLLENKTKFDTLVYGSSRGRFVDVSHVSSKAYNMSHGFGTISTYLQSLKVLLNNGVKVKNVWLGVNDFEIWKDHSNALHKLNYKDGLLGNAPLYAEWLFRIRPKGFKLWKDDAPLLRTQNILNPKAKVDQARIDEKRIKGLKRNIPPTTLGYTGIFRIDESIEELKEIKSICKQHNIKLTVFFYPSFFKTYLRYDQNMIEAFKRKLVSIVDFYDFYDLGALSIDQDNWFEGSHFVPSVADFMIKSIKENKFLVSQENIDARMAQTKSYMKHMSTLPLGDLKPYSGNLDLDIFQVIFDLNDSQYSYYKNDHFNMKNKNGIFNINVHHNDPIFILNTTKTTSKRTLLTFHISSSIKTYFKLYLKKEKNSTYTEKDVFKMNLKKGMNTFSVVTPATYINNELRVDFVNDLGNYTIEKFTIHAL